MDYGKAALAALASIPTGLEFSDSNVARSIAVTLDQSLVKQDYLGGYIEIQPDSWDSTLPSTDATTNAWGFPTSLSPAEQQRVKDFAFNGRSIMYIRLPLGFAYRGYRNIDGTTSLAKNIGERFAGQNAALKAWFDRISVNGGGLAPEYWCPAPYWVTSGTYSGDNQLRAGGSYPMTTTLASIKASDATQYNAQITAFTDAVVNDLEYLHQNIAPVRMFGLQNEPKYSQMLYGACKYDAQTYNDVLEALYPKIQASVALSTYNGLPNTVKLHVASSDETSPFTGIAATFIANHANWIWGYSHHSMRKASGEAYSGGAEWYKSAEFATIKGSKTNVFINEYEYFSTTFGTDDFRCSNNMLHLINEAVYGGAQVLHPVIHICKPLGQTSSDTNTSGYSLFAANLSGNYGVPPFSGTNTYGLNKGAVSPNTWAYNSWAMFGDNLPVGAYLLGDYSKTIQNAGWCAYKYGGKLYLFFANNSAEDVSISISFGASKTFKGKAYSMKYVGDAMKNKMGDTIKFVIPAYSGQSWIEATPAPTVILPNTTLVSDSFNRANSTTTIGNADIGGAWKKDIATTVLGINSNKAYPVTVITDTTIYFDVGNTDVIVSADGVFAGYLALSLRVLDDDNHLRLRLSSAGFALATYINATTTIVVQDTSIVPVNSTTYNIKAVMNGTTIDCYLDGILKFTGTVTSLTTRTRHGLFFSHSFVPNTRYDNFLIKSK
ncbi:hypothetical protein SAMN05216312_102229 [Cohnella sp. OV330]|uniref:hypothetical protein n=1 Tax=Cohnella sp. OV330 TaxID=1855288 RepID=UPI0008F17B0C|nr:hypothetical protein [Cohnella sp. OV330]SFA91769.1 hypothetical protein SAMN05216312_102229 [Cohnella sp. OV330]